VQKYLDWVTVIELKVTEFVPVARLSTSVLLWLQGRLSEESRFAVYGAMPPNQVDEKMIASDVVAALGAGLTVTVTPVAEQAEAGEYAESVTW
jgi:hypothetical protein